MFSKNNPVVLLLDRSGFSLFQGTLVNILRFAFTPDIVANLEVINKDQLYSLISSFIDKNRIYPSIIVLLLTDSIVYEKDLSKIPQKAQPAIVNNTIANSSQKTLGFADKEQQQTEIQNFLQKIPFEDILAKIIKTDTLTRLVAVNRDLIFSTLDSFIKKGFLIEAIVPTFLYGQTVNFTNGLTPDNARIVLRKPELLKAANLLTDQEQLNISQNAYENGKEKKKENKPQGIRKYILIAVFVILLVVLGILLISTQNQNKSLGSKIKNASKNTVVSPSIAPKSAKPDFPIGSSSAILNIEDVKITIVQNSQSETISGLLKGALTKIGFKDIVSENSGGAVPARSSVLFSKYIPTDIRQNAILEINKLLPNVLILEIESPDSRITILVGQS